MKKLAYLLVFLVIYGCKTSQNEPSANGPSEIKTEYPAKFESALKTLGGLSTWNEFRTLEYDVVRGGKTEHQVIDLKNRKVKLTGEGYTIGFDGKDVWVAPDSTAYQGNARFYHNLLFYFFALPYLAADPGINYEDMGEATLDGKNYDKIRITYESNVGDSPEDHYVMYFNKETGLMDLINYSVTYFDASRATQYNALKFENWQEFDGIKLPQELISHKWEGDKLGDARGSYKFEKIKVSKDVTDQKIFEKPDGAYVSPPPSN